MSIKEHGVQKYGKMIKQNVDQANYLAKLVDDSAHLQLLAPVPLNIVCFRFKSDQHDDNTLNELNKELLIQLHESGVAAPSYTLINGRYALRVAITNHRSRRQDFEVLVDEVVHLGNKLVINLPSLLARQGKPGPMAR